MELIQQLEEWKHGHRLGLFKCICGREHKTSLSYARTGKVKSCGCSKGEPASGMRVRYKPEYRAWIDMKSRCFNPKCWAYQYYGERGISVCDEWKHSFLTFYEDMGDRPSKEYSLDRIDNNKGYEKGNCRWATKLEQMNNRRPYRERPLRGEDCP